MLTLTTVRRHLVQHKLDKLVRHGGTHPKAGRKRAANL